MKVRTLFLAVLLIAVGDASAQQISFLPIGRNIEKGIGWVSSQLDSRDYKYRIATDDMGFLYNPNTGSLQDAVERVLRTLKLTPPKGGENAEYGLALAADGFGITAKANGIAGTDPFNYFRLERRGDYWMIPESHIRPAIIYGDPNLMELPTVTGIEVVARSGSKTDMLSSITGKNDFGVLCEIPALRGGLAAGFVGLPREFTVTEAHGGWTSLEITLWENEQFVIDELPAIGNDTVFKFLRGIRGPNDRFAVFDQDGMPIRWSATPPTFFRPPSPIALQKTVNGHLELTVSGEGVLEESVDFAEWHIPYALTVLSENPPRRFRVPQEGGMKFYRLRPAPAAAQTVQKR